MVEDAELMCNNIICCSTDITKIIEQKLENGETIKRSYCAKCVEERKSAICKYCHEKAKESELFWIYNDRHKTCENESDRREYSDLCLACGKLPTSIKNHFYCKNCNKNSQFLGYKQNDVYYCNFCFKPAPRNSKFRCHDECVKRDRNGCTYCNETSKEDHSKCIRMFFDIVESRRCITCVQLALKDDIYCQVCIDAETNHPNNMLVVEI